MVHPALLVVLAGCGPAPPPPPAAVTVVPTPAAHTPDPVADAAPLHDGFRVSLRQDGQTVPVALHRVTLDRRPFTIALEMPEPGAFMVNASHRPESFEAASMGVPAEAIPGFRDTGMADHLENPEQLVLVDDAAPNYWFFESETHHRFDAPCSVASGVVCERTVARVGYGPRTVDLVDAPRTLYLVFLVADRDGDRLVERFRDWLEVELRGP